MQLTIMAAEQFETWVLRPENKDRLFELVDGEIIEKMVSNSHSSHVASIITALIALYIMEHQNGYTMGADGGYQVGAERYIPDSSFISKARLPVLMSAAYLPIAPDLAVEVLSPTNEDEAMLVKVTNYLAAGTVVWLVSPVKRHVQIFTRGQPVRTLKGTDSLDAPQIMPGFAVSVEMLFRQLPPLDIEVR